MNITAYLNGREEVPPVWTRALGSTTIIQTSSEELCFRLLVDRICNMTLAHIHLGKSGENGPAVACLFGPSRFGASSRRIVVNGKLTGAELIGPLQGLSISVLIQEISNCNTYVNVYTVQYPDGEIRGSIVYEHLNNRQKARRN